MTNHDADPPLAAQHIKQLLHTSIAEDDLPRMAWLINHVIGEQLHSWGEAHALQRTLAPQCQQPALLRHRAVAALFAGALFDAWEEQARLCQATGASRSQAEMAIRLGVLQHEAPNVAPAALVQAMSPLMAEMQEWTDYGPLGNIFAGSLNNIVSALLERKDLDIADARQCDALDQASRLCRQIWQAIGGWMQRERADYLVALTCNRIENWSAAAQAAQSGLDMIAANDVEDVDRAFLLLELARAYREMGRQDEHIAKRNEAMALADQFDEAGLREWFDARAAA
jgi:hypothetical protein